MWADGQAFLRVALAVFISVGAINEEKGGPANSREIDYSRVAKMLLHNPLFTELSLNSRPKTRRTIK